MREETQLGSKNARVVGFDNGLRVLVSYTTPVAAIIPNHAPITTEVQYSVTTSSHVSYWTGHVRKDVRQVPQAVLDRLYEKGDDNEVLAEIERSLYS